MSTLKEYTNTHTHTHNYIYEAKNGYKAVNLSQGSLFHSENNY